MLYKVGKEVICILSIFLTYNVNNLNKNHSFVTSTHMSSSLNLCFYFCRFCGILSVFHFVCKSVSLLPTQKK